MLDHNLTRQNVEKARAVQKWLLRLPGLPPIDSGRMSADLSDVYAATAYYQHALDGLLDTSPQDPDRLGDSLADLVMELQHIASHIQSVLPALENLEERLDRSA